MGRGSFHHASRVLGPAGGVITVSSTVSLKWRDFAYNINALMEYELRGRPHAGIDHRLDIMMHMGLGRQATGFDQQKNAGSERREFEHEGFKPGRCVE